jgi:hypothetical protein
MVTHRFCNICTAWHGVKIYWSDTLPEAMYVVDSTRAGRMSSTAWSLSMLLMCVGASMPYLLITHLRNSAVARPCRRMTRDGSSSS